MRLDEQRESDNIEDRRGGGGISSGGLGIGGIVLALVVSYFTGISPTTLLGLFEQTPLAQHAAPAAHKPPADDKSARFVSKILASTEDVWVDVFKRNGQKYEAPRLVLFTGSTPTACGTGQSAMGPFYCPGDHKVYIDLAFYRELRERFKAPGEFAQAYVIAHEVGHHVQNLLGVADKVQKARQRSSRAEANALSVKMELQADCLAGIWGKRANDMKALLDPGDLEAALNAATAIGDDRLQQQSQGHIVPESFTHGSSAQRVRWFKKGFETGDMQQCNTFKAAQL
jgi:predicted metalloprotease